MVDEYYEYGKRAHEAQKQGKYDEAADDYTAAAYVAIGTSEWTNRNHIGSGLASLLTASVCYRLAENPDRSSNRCKQGLLLIEDLRTNFFSEPVQIGLAHELAGDFKIIGELDDYRSEFAAAREAYEECSNHFGWMGEPEFELPINFFIRLAKAADWNLDQETELDISSRSLVDRIEYKRHHFSDILNTVLENGEFVY